MKRALFIIFILGLCVGNMNCSKGNADNKNPRDAKTQSNPDSSAKLPSDTSGHRGFRLQPLFYD